MLSTDSHSHNTGLTVCYSLKTSSNHVPNTHENYRNTHFCRKMAKNKVIKNVIVSGLYRGKGL